MDAFWEMVTSFLSYKLIHIGDVFVSVGGLLELLLYLFLTVVAVRLLRRAILERKNTRLELGRRKAIFNLFKYAVWVMGLLVMLNTVGMKVSYLLAGGAALLVGLGFGIQHIFNDVISGIILQVEGTIAVGDVIEVETLVGIVKEIHLRTSLVQTRDDTMIIVPNSRFVNDKVINWSHITRHTRFNVHVGVAYGSDVDQVTEALMDCMRAQVGIEQSPSPKVWFEDFADSALMFRCLFWSREAFGIEGIKSELRYKIYKKFDEEGIQIPFPQRDLHLRTWDASVDRTLISDGSKV